MSLLWANPADPFRTPIHPALTSFADELCATVARIFLYVGTLALLAIFTIHGWDRLRLMIAAPAAQIGWSVAGDSRPAFAVNQPNGSITYTALRHAMGGRKDVLRWTGSDDQPVAELEIYRPGREFNPARPIEASLAARMRVVPPRLEAAGLVDSKFGPVELVARPDATEPPAACLGFVKRVAEPHLQMSGWSCRGDGPAAQRAAIGCMLDRLVLLGAGNEPKLAPLFARAEPGGTDCAGRPADWVTAADEPQLRGSL
ncbi:MAG: hypothetical protein JOY90_20750 [Bradyrhizobium sp.]|uniref:hypothetical protein n=1 Tax=Bradyrhizobium sp. TaxID=376 RepID=UPI001D2534E8|nr:hypothetical protein [Bradyrhizobium sp.]MBV9562845.1 hypothetical protein [Bradyrhizobium sp.]